MLSLKECNLGTLGSFQGLSTLRPSPLPRMAQSRQARLGQGTVLPEAPSRHSGSHKEAAFSLEVLLGKRVRSTWNRTPYATRRRQPMRQGERQKPARNESHFQQLLVEQTLMK